MPLLKAILKYSADEDEGWELPDADLELYDTLEEAREGVLSDLSWFAQFERYSEQSDKREG